MTLVAGKSFCKASPFTMHAPSLHIVEGIVAGHLSLKQSLSCHCSTAKSWADATLLHRPLNGPFRGAVFHHGGVPETPPISVNGAFALLNGPFSLTAVIVL